MAKRKRLVARLAGKGEQQLHQVAARVGGADADLRNAGDDVVVPTKAVAAGHEGGLCGVHVSRLVRPSVAGKTGDHQLVLGEGLRDGGNPIERGEEGEDLLALAAGGHLLGEPQQRREVLAVERLAVAAGAAAVGAAARVAALALAGTRLADVLAAVEVIGVGVVLNGAAVGLAVLKGLTRLEDLAPLGGVAAVVGRHLALWQRRDAQHRVGRRVRAVALRVCAADETLLGDELRRAVVDQTAEVRRHLPRNANTESHRAPDSVALGALGRGARHELVHLVEHPLADVVEARLLVRREAAREGDVV